MLDGHVSEREAQGQKMDLLVSFGSIVVIEVCTEV